MISTQDKVSSWYEASKNLTPSYAPLPGDINTDICVIGGGLTGISTAYHLQLAGYKSVLIEGNSIGSGASGRNGGQMIIGYSCDYSKLSSLAGEKSAQKLWDLSVESVRYTKKIITDNKIDCDLVDGHLHVGFKDRHTKELQLMVDELGNDFNYEKLEFLDKSKIQSLLNTKKYNAAVYSSESGHLHPLNFTLGFADLAERKGVSIHENTAAIKISKDKPLKVTTNKGIITCKYVIVAGNAYIEGDFDKLRSTIMPVGTYMIATESLGKKRGLDTIRNNAAVADVNFVLDYYRLSKDFRMLYGGRVSYSTLDPINIKSSIRRRMLSIYPQLGDIKIEYAWGGFVAITINRFPHFGRLRDDVYFAQGFSGHGVALTGFAGKLMADSIAKTSSDFDIFEKVKHIPFPGGRWFRTPALVMGMLYYRLRDLL